MSDRSFPVLVVIAIGVWVLILQNAGVIPEIPTVSAEAQLTQAVRVVGQVDVNITDAENTLDVNLHSVVGRRLVESSRGMAIGVSGEKNTLIPINWGEVSVVP